MNRWTGTGHLTKDPKLLETDGGTAICTLRIAVRRAGKQGKDGYFDVKCFDGQAHACADYLKAGREAAIDGRLHLEEFQTEDRGYASRVYVIAERVEFLNSRKPPPIGPTPRRRPKSPPRLARRAATPPPDAIGPAAASPGRPRAQTSPTRHDHTENPHHRAGDAYWRLVEPLPADEIERANRRLAHALGADAASADAARILRVPATYSHKYEPPVSVEAVRLDVERRLHAADVIGALRDPPPPPRTDTLARVALRGDDPLLSIPPDLYVQRLLGVEVPRHRKVRCPFHADRHASLHVYKTAERGWYCFGRCRRGGTIYDLAAPLYGYELRGEDFLRLRAQLQRLFGVEAPDA